MGEGQGNAQNNDCDLDIYILRFFFPPYFSDLYHLFVFIINILFLFLPYIIINIIVYINIIFIYIYIFFVFVL